jgi:rhodanese-related sulfurtransferase
MLCSGQDQSGDNDLISRKYKIEYMKNVLTSLLLFSMVSCHGQQDSSRKIGPDKFEKGIAKPGIQILDVRTSGEYNNGHIKNSLLADWTNREQFNDRIQYVDKNKPVYVYCAVGGRSSAAAAWMRQNGFTNVLELNGGFNDWKKERQPTNIGQRSRKTRPPLLISALPGARPV